MKNFNNLTPEEKTVIIYKGTEQPYTGKFNLHYKSGTYICKQCSSELFRSEAKFDAGCGWPSFDAAIPGRVKWVKDADGKRTEIVCKNCDGHLGHVFVGEGFTRSDTRYCVNSISLEFKEKG